MSTPRGPIISETRPRAIIRIVAIWPSPQVGVHEAQRERRVAVALRFDEGDLPLAPVDRHRPVEREAARGKRRQTLGDILLVRQGREERAGGQCDGRSAESEPDGEGGKNGNHAVLQDTTCSPLYAQCHVFGEGRAEPPLRRELARGSGPPGRRHEGGLVVPVVVSPV